MKQVLLTGIKPTGDIHLGNYLGMMKPVIDLAQNLDFDEMLVFVANYHAMNSVQDAQMLREQTRSAALGLLAAGLDPERVTLFYQSDVPELTELTWMFNNLVTVSYLERSHAYKDAVANGKEANMGLFDYPVLMAADILMYDSTIIPVGQDQKQHVEIAQKLYQKFTKTYGEGILIRPKPLISEEVGTVVGLDGRKMSKSYKNTIELFESESSTTKKIMSITTDSLRPEDPKDPDSCTIMEYYRLVASPEAISTLEDRYRKGGLGYREAKEILAQAMNAYLRPMREKYAMLQQDPETVDSIMRRGGEIARKKAIHKMQLVRKATGIIE